MTKALANNFEYVMKIRERLIWSLFAIAVCFAMLYGFFMEKTISNTASLSLLQRSLSRESSSVSQLSEQYVALSQNVTLDSALAEGFVEAPVSAFITVSAPVASGRALSMNISPASI